MSAHLTDFNYLGNQTVVAPAPIGNLPSISGSASNFVWNVPAYSINVIQFDLSQAVSAGTNPSPVANASASSPLVSYTSDGQPQYPTTTLWVWSCRYQP